MLAGPKNASDSRIDADAAELARLKREIDYWRRLVLARLDLAVACVIGACEPDPWSLFSTGTTVPRGGMRHLVGVDSDPLAEVATLEQLRRALADLDDCAARLRATPLPVKQ